MSVLVDVTFTPSHPLSLDDRLLITGGPDPSTPPQDRSPPLPRGRRARHRPRR